MDCTYSSYGLFPWYYLSSFYKFYLKTFVAITSIVDAVKLLEKAGLQFERVISRSENVTIFYKVFPAQNSEEVSSAESVFA